MRKILDNELESILHRRGLRTREWAVEREDSAIYFLLEKGFTPNMGARPLKRAIERYLLSPLALTIVNHQFPEGDQFLFVRSDTVEIQVEFIDPDSGIENSAESGVLQADTSWENSEVKLGSILLDPKDAYLQILTNPSTQVAAEAINDFALQLQRMYVNWAQKRRMKFKVLDKEKAGEYYSYHCILSFSGFGAYSILSGENGLHVLEIPKREKSFVRFNVSIQVTPQPDILETGIDAEVNQAKTELARKTKMTKTIVRRYRYEPSPLVRDNRRNWRTGRLDRVFDGDFDLYG